MLNCKVSRAAGVSALAVAAVMFGGGTARAQISNPSTITLNAGPLGPLNFSGGADGYTYALTGTGSKSIYGTTHSTGVELLNTILDLSKTTGEWGFDIHYQPSANFAFAETPAAPYYQTYALGPIKAAFLTLSPNSTVSFDIGELFSLEGYEGSKDWGNADFLESSAYWAENGSDLGAQINISKGPLYLSLQYGDGFETKVFNYLQAYAGWTFNSDNVLNAYLGANLGATGENAEVVGYPGAPYGDPKNTVGSYDSFLINSDIVGAYYNYTVGSFTVTPEIQYAWAKPDHRVGVDNFASAFTALATGGYSFAGTPYSLGYMVDYFTGNGPYNWYLHAHSEGINFSITPTWQKGNFFVRADAGLIHLINIGSGAGFGSNGKGKDGAEFALETGVVF